MTHTKRLLAFAAVVSILVAVLSLLGPCSAAVEPPEPPRSPSSREEPRRPPPARRRAGPPADAGERDEPPPAADAPTGPADPSARLELTVREFTDGSPVAGAQFSIADFTTGNEVARVTTSADGVLVATVDEQVRIVPVDDGLGLVAPDHAVFAPDSHEELWVFRAGVVRGVVRFDPPGEPKFENVKVSLLPTPRRPGEWQGDPTRPGTANFASQHHFKRWSITPDPSGRFVLAAPLSPEIAVAAVAPGWRVAVERTVLGREKTDAEVALVLRKSPRVRFAVEGPDRRPVAGATVAAIFRRAGGEVNPDVESFLSGLVGIAAWATSSPTADAPGEVCQRDWEVKADASGGAEVEVRLPPPVVFLVRAPGVPAQLVRVGDVSGPVRVVLAPHDGVPRRYRLLRGGRSLGAATVTLWLSDGDDSVQLDDSIRTDDDGTLAPELVAKGARYVAVVEVGRELLRGPIQFGSVEDVACDALAPVR